MPFNFIECNREQQFLMPPDIRDWVPAGDLAWYIMDAVDRMDLSLSMQGTDGTAGAMPPMSRP